MVNDDNALHYSFIDSYSEWKDILLDSDYDINPNFFRIEYPFFNKKNTSRKRKAPTNEFLELQEYHQKLEEVLNKYRCKLKNENFFSLKSDKNAKPHNEEAIEIAQKLLDHDILMKTCSKLSESQDFQTTDKNLEYFHQFTENTSDQWTSIEIFSTNYMMPPHSAFLMSDIKFANKLIRSINKKFDLIVIDPPVKNKSVKNAYGFLDELDLLELPVKHVVKEDSLVAVWCTNSEKCLESVESCLFRAWNVKLKAVCCWLKVTIHGESVLDLNDRFRRPYERLLIGRVCSDNQPKVLSEKDPVGDLDERVILSVPCSLHSAKPNLQKFLGQYLPENPQCLELFARNLYTGWVSWGNEPLKFLNRDLMIPKIESKENPMFRS